MKKSYKSSIEYIYFCNQHNNKSYVNVRITFTLKDSWGKYPWVPTPRVSFMFSSQRMKKILQPLEINGGVIIEQFVLHDLSRCSGRLRVFQHGAFSVFKHLHGGSLSVVLKFYVIISVIQIKVLKASVKDWPIYW